MSKAGRPFSEDPRVNRVFVRLNEKETKTLDSVSKNMGMSRSDAIRTLVERYEKDMK